MHIGVAYVHLRDHIQIYVISDNGTELNEQVNKIMLERFRQAYSASMMLKPSVALQHPVSELRLI